MSEHVKPLAQFGSLVLTPNRLQRVTTLEIGSALLTEIDAVTVRHERSPAFIWLAVLFLAGGYSLSKMSPDLKIAFVLASGLALACLGGYYLTRRTLLSVFAGVVELSTAMGGSGIQEARVFIDAIESAKMQAVTRGGAPAPVTI